MSTTRAWIFTGIFLVLFTIVSSFSALNESLTFDEIVHIEEGYHALIDQTFRVDTNNPPLIRELAVLPLLLRSADKNVNTPPNIAMFPARFIMILLGVALGIILFWTASSYFGNEAGLLSLVLYVFDPMMLGYAHYVTQDIGSALFFFLGYMSLIWLMKNPSWVMFTVHGICMGLMASSKITTLPYYILADLIIVPYILRGRIITWFRSYAIQIVVSIGIFVLTIWSTYFFRFNVIVAPNNAQGRVSTFIREKARERSLGFVITGMNVLEKQPVPLGDYIGVIKNTIVRSFKAQEIYFLGNKYPKSHWHFMPITLLLKTSLPLLFLAIGGLIYIKGKKSERRIFMIILAPMISILLVSSMSGMQPLVRYALPLYPFLILLGGAGFSLADTRIKKFVLLIIVLWHIVRSLSFFPHFISFGNEFAGDRKFFVTRFFDSNVDWGQSLPDLKRFIDRHKPTSIQFSYFGRDNAQLYGMQSDFAFGSHKFNEICAFHTIYVPKGTGRPITAISGTNWYACGYYLDPDYSWDNRIDIIGDSILIF